MNRGSRNQTALRLPMGTYRRPDSSQGVVTSPTFDLISTDEIFLQGVSVFGNLLAILARITAVGKCAS